MNIGTTGIIIDQKMQLLVIKRNDTRTWTTPGGSLDPGELLTEGVVREVEEETGFKVFPVRLVSMSYIAEMDNLQFVFRCLLRGGEARTSRESLDVGFIPTSPIKAPMLNLTKARIERALVHHDNTPQWYRITLLAREKMLYQFMMNAYYPAKNWIERTFQKRHYIPHIPPKDWLVSVNLILKRADGAICWIDEGEGCVLPSAETVSGEAPWESAEKVGQMLLGVKPELNHLSGVYNLDTSQRIVLVFSAEIPPHTTLPASAQLSTSIPENAHPLHRERAEDAFNPLNELTVLKRQSAE
ncbi:MAG: NUDIX domain-containing protein [Candidatus Promineifilaceae bacterium]